MVVVADTGPLHYLLLAGYIEVIPALYKKIVIPPAVARELSHPRTPSQVRFWFDTRPTWLSIQSIEGAFDQWVGLDIGERESVALAVELRAELLLMDDAAGRQAASSIANLKVTGTLGILYQAALEGYLDSSHYGLAFDEAILRLRKTNFFFNKKLDKALQMLGERLRHMQVD